MKTAKTQAAKEVAGTFGQLPFPLAAGIALAWSVAATMEGVHIHCRRRECRRLGRCAATQRHPLDLCTMPLSGEADARVRGMLVFAHRLANGIR